MNRFPKAERKIYRVSELVQNLNQVLESEFSEIYVQGEISGFKKAKGNYFFTLKDEQAKLEVFMSRFSALYLRFQPENGLEVIVRGYLNFFAPRGELRLVADTIDPVGIGALQLAFEQLKKKLAQEGLFDESRKKPLPEFFRRIAIITSPTGAVIRDILRVFREQDIKLEVLLIPSRVQGEGAEYELVKAIEQAHLPQIYAPTGRPPLDLIILARGGGSFEDLYPFNTEPLARAIAKSKIPVMSAVGHEIDYTISDMVADIRALTPTRAAEMIAQRQKDVINRLNIARESLEKIILNKLELATNSLKIFFDIGRKMQDQLKIIEKELLINLDILRRFTKNALEQKAKLVEQKAKQLFAQSPHSYLRNEQKRLYELGSQLAGLARWQINQNQERLSHLVGRLESLSPLSTLSRGYSITKRAKDGKILKDPKDIELEEMIDILLYKGELKALVKDKKSKKPSDEIL